MLLFYLDPFPIVSVIVTPSDVIKNSSDKRDNFCMYGS